MSSAAGKSGPPVFVIVFFVVVVVRFLAKTYLKFFKISSFLVQGFQFML